MTSKQLVHSSFRPFVLLYLELSTELNEIRDPSPQSFVINKTNCTSYIQPQ